MRKIFSVIGLLMVLNAPLWGANVETEISRVTVYSDRAMVTRTGTAQLPVGDSELILSGLPPAILDDSLRVSGSSAGSVTVTGTEIKETFLADPRKKEVDRLEKKIDELKSGREEVNGRLEALKRQEKFIDSIGSSTGEKISEQMLVQVPDPAGWGKVLDFIGAASLDIAAKRRDADRLGRQIDKEITAAQKELKEIESYRSREAKEVSITVSAREATLLRLEVSYVIWGATWRPVYDARAEREKGTVDFTYRAEVRQKTGEDWNGVELGLSTARPSVGGRPGELSPWYIRIYSPPQLGRGRADMLYSKAAPAPARQAAGEALGEMEEVVSDQARAEKTGAAVNFLISRAQEIPSDGSFHGVAVSRKEVPAEFEYTAVPKLIERAYLMASFTNEENYPLLAGKVNLFLGKDFVGSSRLDTIASGEKCELYLGVDEDIKVSRNLVAEKTEKGGWFKGDTGYKNFAYRIKVENYRSSPIKITVFDQIPVSQSPDVSVELEKVSPPPVTIPEKEEPGLLAWRLNPGPGATGEITFSFTVEYPKDKQLSGL